MRLIAEDLACERSGRVVFRDLSFAVEAGEALAVVGPNGAGKSTLLRLVAGLLKPSAGTLTIAVEDSDADADAAVAERVHYLGHKDALKPALTPVEILEFWSAWLGDGPKGASPRAALERVGLLHTADLPSAYLSAGQRKRLSLARLLVAPRPVWLLDEPTNALDVASQETLRGLCADHAGSGGLIMIATHAETGIPTRSLALGGRA
jgi:heme exporter protein A